MLGLSRAVHIELLDALLRCRRLLVIIDHFSEMASATREQVLNMSTSFPVKALLITSRFKEDLRGITATELQPLRVDAERLIEFMSGYLRIRGARDAFDDDSFIEACRKLKALVGRRSVTILFIRMFADQLVETLDTSNSKALPDLISRVNAGVHQSFEQVGNRR